MDLIPQIAQLVKDVGFPVFVAMWLLVKVGPALDQLTRSVTKLTAVLGRRAEDQDTPG